MSTEAGTVKAGMSQAYLDYCAKLQAVPAQEYILSMGETRIGTEHTAVDDARWHQPRAEGGRILVVDLDVWELTGTGLGVLFFARRKP